MLLLLSLLICSEVAGVDGNGVAGAADFSIFHRSLSALLILLVLLMLVFVSNIGSCCWCSGSGSCCWCCCDACSSVL